MSRCKALLVCNGGDKTMVGVPCNERAVALRNGRHVCWLHKGAQRKLEYAKAQKSKAAAA